MLEKVFSFWFLVWGLQSFVLVLVFAHFLSNSKDNTLSIIMYMYLYVYMYILTETTHWKN